MHHEEGGDCMVETEKHAVRHLYDCGLSRGLGIQDRKHWQTGGQPAGLR